MWFSLLFCGIITTLTFATNFHDETNCNGEDVFASSLYMFDNLSELFYQLDANYLNLQFIFPEIVWFGVAWSNENCMTCVNLNPLNYVSECKEECLIDLSFVISGQGDLDNVDDSWDIIDCIVISNNNDDILSDYLNDPSWVFNSDHIYFNQSFYGPNNELINSGYFNNAQVKRLLKPIGNYPGDDWTRMYLLSQLHEPICFTWITSIDDAFYGSLYENITDWGVTCSVSHQVCYVPTSYPTNHPTSGPTLKPSPSSSDVVTPVPTPVPTFELNIINITEPIFTSTLSNSGACDTAIAYYNDEESQCINTLIHSNRWGWTNGPFSYDDNTIYLELYSGAGQCDWEHKGTYVGQVKIEQYSECKVKVTYIANNNYYFSEIHLYVGEDLMYKVGGEYSAAWGLYPYSYGFDDTKETSVTISINESLCNSFYVVAHCKICLSGTTTTTSTTMTKNPTTTSSKKKPHKGN